MRSKMNEAIMLVLVMTLVSLSFSDGVSIWPQPMPSPSRFKDVSDSQPINQLFIPYLRRQPWGCEIPRQMTINRLIFAENKAIYKRRPNHMPKPETCTCAPDPIGFRPVDNNARIATILRQQSMPSMPMQPYIPYLRVVPGCPLPPRANTINRLIYKENQDIYDRNSRPWDKPDKLPDDNCTCADDDYDSLPYPPDFGYPDTGFGLGAPAPSTATTTTTTRAPQVIIVMPTRPSRVRPPIRPIHIIPGSIGWRWRHMINQRKHNSQINGHSLAGNGEDDDSNNIPHIFSLLKRND